MELPVPGDVLWIARELERAGFEAWAVGGAVRDALAGGRPEDWDLTTPARPQQVRKIFRRTVPLGLEYGTVGVIAPSGHMYEVTTFRRDVETFGRKARVAFADTLEEDLDRRDFTINAVAWNPLTGEVRDPHGGVDDLSEGILRTVGDPEERFSEDRLRVLRGLRFAGRFGLAIDPPTWAAMQASSDRLDALSPERIREELWKILTGQKLPSNSLRLYRESGVLAALFPELVPSPGERREGEPADDWEYVTSVVDAVSPARPIVRMAALLHVSERRGDEGDTARASAATARQILQRLRSSNAEVDRVTHLIAQHAPLPTSDADGVELRRWIRGIGRDYVNDVFRLLFAICRARGEGLEPERIRGLYGRSREVLRSRIPLTVQELPIGGADLRELGITPGPRFGEILRSLLDRVTEEPALNDAERLREIVRREELRAG